MSGADGGNSSTVDFGRRAHYAEFYDPGPETDLALVWGNCQAEAVRVLLAGSAGFPLRPVRVPPVHELQADDLRALRGLLRHTRLLISQPVRDGYRGLPLGTAEISAQLDPGTPVVRIPVIRYAGLHPYGAIVRHPADPGLDPPVVPYHDLRTLSLAAGRTRRSRPGPEILRAAAARSIAALEQRERGTDVAVSDVLLSHGADAAHTLNHPGNRILIELARRIQAHLGLPVDADEPGRELLGDVKAPLEADVVAALGLGGAPRPTWTRNGVIIEPEEIHEAHIVWYAEHPPVVQAGLLRHGDRLELLGL